MIDTRSAASTRRFLACLAVSAVALAACSTGDAVDESASTDAPAATDGPSATEPPVTLPPVTAPPTTDVPVTTDPVAADPAVTEPAVAEPAVTDPGAETGSPPPDLSFLWNGVEETVAAWNSANETINAAEPDTVQRLVVDLDEVAIGGLQSAGEGFAALDAFPPGFLSGTIDPGGEVSALVTTVDPTIGSAASAVTTSLTALATVWAEGGIEQTDVFVVDVLAAYDRLAATPPSEPPAQEFVPGPFGTPYVVVLSHLPEGAPGVPVIEVAAIPVPEEEVARSVVELLRLELRAVTG